MKFRTGASGRTLRVQIGDHPDDMDLLIGIVDSADQANIIVNAVNAVARLRELHKPKELSNGYSPVYVCSHCQPDEESRHVDYPCPTIRAIDGSDDE